MRALPVRAGSVAAAVALACGVGCGSPEWETGKGVEEPFLADAKLDSFQKPTDHGALAFGEAAKAELTKSAAFHAWTFSLSGDAKLTITTAPQTKTGRAVDTVLYLYKKKDNGTWGSYVARNDDDGNKVWSKVVKQLAVGEYRIIVKGYDKSDLGKFALNAACDGVGCQAPDPAAECVFGSTFNEMPDTILVNKQRLTAASPISDLTGQQIVSALHASSHTDVTTVTEAFAAADQGEINKLELYDLRGARAFTAYEYGAGDNSYGRYFAVGTVDAVADIHDGDIQSCTVRAADCLFGQTYHEGIDSGRFTVAKSVLTDGNTLSALQQSQLIAAVRESNDAVTTLAEAFDSVDGGEINFVQLTEKTTGKKFVAFEFGAGDNSYGAFFAATESQPAAAIHDGDLYACRYFR